MGSYTAEDWYLLLPEELKSRVTGQSIRDMSRKIRQLNGKYNVWISNTVYLNLLSYCIIRQIRAAVLEESREFFEMAETTLQVRIPISERTAFFLYIIEEE